MHFDKLDAINLAAATRKAISKLKEWTPDSSDMENEREEISIVIFDLESSLEKLDKAIEDCPTQFKDENGKWY